MINKIKQRFDAWRGEKLGDPGSTPKKYICGTLRYTSATMTVLFGWLLWGDFTMTLMESMPGLLVMQLKDHAISNQAMGVLLGTIATLLNVALNPVVSYASDHYRSRWGRRRPFLMFATPFVTLFLILIPWSPEITAALLKVHVIRMVLEWIPIAPLVLVFGLNIGLFGVFNMFIGTNYYYLIVDTVPEPFIGRFYGLFRVFGILAGMLFSWFVFGHAHTHMRSLFAIFGLLYAVSFTLMCWKVREGEYADVQEEHGHWYSPIKNYATECFGHGRNWVIFLIYASTQWAGVAGMFALFFYRDQIGLTEKEFGRLTAIACGANLLLSAPFGVLVDRLGSQKSLMIGLVTGVLVSLLCFFIIHNRITAFVLGFTMNIPVFLIFLAMGKWTVDMYPRAQYGQFGSAGAIVGAAGAAILTPLSGKIVDVFGNYYRLCLIVPAIGFGIGLVLSIVLYHWPQATDPAKMAAVTPES